MVAVAPGGITHEALWRENQELRARAERAEQSERRCKQHVAALTHALSNSELQPAARITAVFAEHEIEHRRSNGEVDAQGWTPICISAIADRAGVSSDTASRYLKDLDTYGICERQVRHVSDPETGNVRTQVMVRQSGGALEGFRAIARVKPDEIVPDRKRQGGRRDPKISVVCPDCGSDDTVLTCHTCGCTHPTCELLAPESDGPLTESTEAVPTPQDAASSDDTNIAQFVPKPQDAASVMDAERSDFVKDDGSSVPTKGNGNGQHAPDPSFFVPPTPEFAASNTSITESGFAASVEVMVERPPSELLEGAQFVGWRIEVRDGKPTKIPVGPLTGHEASSTDPSTWGTLEQAKAAVKLYGLRGVGRMLHDDFTVFEIDDCRNALTGEIDQDALGIMRRLDSYTEISPSGEGLHIWLRGKKPTHRCRRGRYECYDHARYFTITCQRVTSVSGAIENRPAELAAVCRTIFPGDLAAVPAGKPQLLLNDSDIYEKLAGNQKFQYLDRGDSASYPSHSEADMAYFCMLARFTSDPGQIERIARSSNRQREKWDKHSSYLRDSIERAIQFVGSRP